MAITGVPNSKLLTLLNTTLPAFKKGRLNVAFDRNTYEVINRWHRSDRVTEQGGNIIEERLVLDENGNARWVRMFEPTEPRVSDGVKKLQVNWCHAETHYGWERRELLQNMAPRQIVKLIKPRRLRGILSLANLMESGAWAAPDPLDDTIPWGLKYWIVPLADGQAGAGFYGCHPTGFTDVGGIAAATSNANQTNAAGGEPLWRNYAAGGDGYYTAVNEEFLDTLADAYISVQFEAPHFLEDYTESPKGDQRIYTNKSALKQYERLARMHNDDLGNDLGKFHGATAYKSIPIKYIKDLDSDTRDPWYMVNHNFFETRALNGDHLHESEAQQAPWNHNVLIVFWDDTHNYICRNRQRQAVIRKTA